MQKKQANTICRQNWIITLRAFTLVEVLITLGIIGIVSTLTIPILVQNSQEKALVGGLLKFHTNLQNAIQMYKNDNNCLGRVYDCLIASSADPNYPAEMGDRFNYTIGKYLKIDKTANGLYINEDWLPDDSYDYYGDIATGSLGGVSNKCEWAIGAFLLEDGTVFEIYGGAEIGGYEIYVDVNGKKPPNRAGKDQFRMLLGLNGIGLDNNYDINYFDFYGGNDNGLCNCWSDGCNSNNTNPTLANGAMPTSYVLLNHKLPDFSALSKTISGFKP